MGSMVAGQLDDDRLIGDCTRLIAAIDAAVSRQVDAIIHAGPFQALEASWRGLALLAATIANTRMVRLKVLDVSWGDVCRDLEHAVEFDQSALFHLIYSDEIGMPGGLPFGLLIGDYHVCHTPGAGRVSDDVAAMRGLAAIAAAAFCPLVLSASPALLGLEQFGLLGTGLELARAFDGDAFIRWRALRHQEDTRFLGVVLPRVLLRQVWPQDDRHRLDGFRYVEDIGPDGEGLLWGNAAFVFGVAVIRRFDQSGWFADLRGVSQDRDTGGLVRGLPAFVFGTDRHAIAAQAPLEVRVSGVQEQELSELGLLPLTAAPYTASLLFNTNASLHAPPAYDRAEATWNARLSSMLQYMLCVSRFAHYLLMMMRDRVGSSVSASDVQRQLNTWIAAYCLGSDGATDEMRARFPLRDAGIEVNEVAGRPGALGCVFRLQPHFQLDSIATSFRLVTELTLQRR